MAAINFINISIASSLKRSKEVGVRKVSGGSRMQIIFQFLHESTILCIIAFLVSVLLLNISLPLFNSLTGKKLVVSESMDITLVSYFIATLYGIILLTGIYPAYVLSNFKPSEVLYNKQKLSGRNLLGRGLMVFQFALTVFLLIATIVYNKQMDYIRTKDLGYNPNQIVRTAIGGDRDYKQVISFLKAELSKEPSISRVSFGNEGYDEDMYVNGKVFKGVYKNIDENFLPALEIPLKAGKNFSAVISANERQGVIVNEAFVKAAGLQYPIGQPIKINRYFDSSLKIITGVVKDFHFGSLREPIKPMAMFMNEWPDGGMWVKFEKSKHKQAVAALERIYKQVMPNAIFNYNFLDELNAMQYLQEKRWHKIITIATTLSFIICCLGLFGLAHLSTNRRTKEIGIRKVLGASTSQIAATLSRDFLKLVVIGFVIAAPISWIVIRSWLQDFAYRTEISWLVFLAAGAIAVSIAILTVSFQAIKAAIANPVQSLRTE
jgi:putative ABC transport system permease protein